MENGSRNAAINGSTVGASFDMLSTGPTAPVSAAANTPAVPQPSSTPEIPTPTPQKPISPKNRPGRTKLLLAGGIIVLALIFVGGILFALQAFRGTENERQNISGDFDNVEIPLDQLIGQPGINVLGARSLVINGQLRTNDGLVVAPSTAPTAPTAGQIYYDKGTNQLGYYNGSQFIYVAQDQQRVAVDSIGGATGAIATGTGLQLVGGSLNNTGVLSFQGQTGAVTLRAGSGVTIDGNTISNNGDLTTGNEVTDVVSGGGLLRVGTGTTVNPYKVALQTCANGEVLKSSGATWACGSDNGTVSTAGNGLQIVGNEFSVNSPTCSGTDKLSWNGTAFVCSADLGGTEYSAGTGLSLVAGTFSNTGTLSVTASGALTSSGGQNPNIAFANGSSAGQFWQWNGSAWALATLPVAGDPLIGNEVTDVTGVNSGLVRSGSGTGGSPYTLAVNAGDGLQLSSGAVRINSAACSGTDKLQWTGIGFICSTDVDTNTTYSTITNAGLRLSGTNFGLQICANGEVLQAQAVSGQWGCVAPSSFGVAYTAGNGLGLAGNQFAVNSPTCSGTDKLQWTGTAFQCSSDVDTNTDAQTLSWVPGTRTLGISNGNSVVIGDSDTTYSALANGGMRLVGTQFALSVCANGDVMRAQAVSGEWACSTDNNTTYTAGTGLNLVGNTFSNSGILTVTGSGAINVTAGQNPTVAFANGSSAGQYWQWNGSVWTLATFTEVDGVIGNEVTNATGVNSGLTRSGSGTSVSPFTLGIMSCANTEILQSSGAGAWACASPSGVGTSYNIITNGGLRLAGSNFGLKTCTAGELLQAQATSGEWDCVTSTGVGTSYVGGTGINIAGSTINNTGVISVAGSGPITSTGGQNPSLTFVSGSSNGQFWQWNGSAWALATLPNEGDATVGNEVTDVTGANSGLTRSGSGTSGSPYTLAVNASNGLQLSGGAVLINSPTCSGTTKLQWNGSAFICSTDVDTTYGTIASGGLRLSGTNFGLQICASGELLQAQVTSGQWGCVAANTVGLAYTAGNGLGLAGNQFAVNSPTCAGTDKLQWNGTAFACSTDVDAQTLSWVSGTRTLSISGGNNVVIGDADTTYSPLTNGGLRLVGTQFALSTCTTNQIMKAQATSGEWGCAADNDTTYTGGTGISLVGTTINNSGILSLTGTSNINITAGQNPTIGFASGSSNGQVWQWNGSAWVLATISAGGVDTLQAGYTASTGGTTPEIKLDTTRGGLDIQDANSSIGANLLNVRASNGSGLGSTLFGIGNTGIATFQNSVDSSAALKVLSAAGGSILNVDTAASKVSFGVYADFDSMTKLSNPATLPTQRVIGLSWSPDSTYAVAGFAVDSPYMHIYKRSGDTFTKLPNPSTLPTSHARVSSWSPDGTYMSIAHVSSPYVTIYKRSGDTFTKLPDPSSLPTGDGYATAWSPDGQYMTVAHDVSPYITVYKRSGDTFTKLTNPASLPAGIASSVAWSPDGQYMTIGHDTSPYITIYKRSGDTFTKLANPATLPTGGSGALSTGVAWSPDSTYLVMAHATSPYITIYKRSGDTFTKLADPASLPVGNGTAVSWSPTGNYLSVAHQAGSSCDDIYSRSGDTFTKLAEASPAPLGDCRSTAWSPDGRFVLAGNDNSPYFNIYKAGDGGPRVDADIFGRLSVVGTTSITQGNLTVDGNISSSSLLSAQTLSVSGASNLNGDATFRGNVTFNPETNSTTAFKIQKTVGGVSSVLFNVDTTSSIVSVWLPTSGTNSALCSSASTGGGYIAGLYELRDCSSTPTADYMEMYSVSPDVQTGDIVAPSDSYVTTKDGERIAKLTKSTSAYQNSVIGIASTPQTAGDFNSVGHNINDADRPFPVALSGRVKVKMSESSPAIEPGDYITASGEAGKGTKAIQKGQVVGKALESWTPGAGQSTVMVYVSLEWRDPGQADTGDMFIEDKLSLGVQEVTLTDDDIANDTIAPTASFIRINQDSGAGVSDPALGIVKTAAKDGDTLIIVNSDASRVFTLSDGPDINVPGSSIVVGTDDTVSLIYSKDHWVVTSTSDN